MARQSKHVTGAERGQSVKTIHLVAGVVAFIFAATTYAAGDHTQGTNVCGAGLEVLDASGRSTGDCLAVASGSPPSGPFYLNDGTPGSKITINGSCLDKGVYLSCPNASFDKASSSGQSFCTKKPGQSLSLLLIKATVSKGLFTFTPGALTPVCEGGESKGKAMCRVPLPEKYSTAADCISWGYDPTNSTHLFNTCIRMARADYLGLGTSATRPGVHIQPYTGTGGDQPACSENPGCCGGCFEASWDESGAVCIDHNRVSEVLARLVAFAGYSQKDAERFFKDKFGSIPPDQEPKERRKKQGRTGKPVDARAMAASAGLGAAPPFCRQGAKQADALLSNRSRLGLCTSSTVPVAFTDCHLTHPDPCPTITPCPPP
jgi:ADYC domain-containing protein